MTQATFFLEPSQPSNNLISCIIKTLPRGSERNLLYKELETTFGIETKVKKRKEKIVYAQKIKLFIVDEEEK